MHPFNNYFAFTISILIDLDVKITHAYIKSDHRQFLESQFLESLSKTTTLLTAKVAMAIKKFLSGNSLSN